MGDHREKIALREPACEQGTTPRTAEIKKVAVRASMGGGGAMTNAVTELMK